VRKGKGRVMLNMYGRALRKKSNLICGRAWALDFRCNVQAMLMTTFQIKSSAAKPLDEIRLSLMGQ
jgi:hypothetical protein